jgi:hypothetical protein
MRQELDGRKGKKRPFEDDANPHQSLKNSVCSLLEIINISI